MEQPSRPFHAMRPESFSFALSICDRIGIPSGGTHHSLDQLSHSSAGSCNPFVDAVAVRYGPEASHLFEHPLFTHRFEHKRVASVGNQKPIGVIEWHHVSAITALPVLLQ